MRSSIHFTGRPACAGEQRADQRGRPAGACCRSRRRCRGTSRRTRDCGTPSEAARTRDGEPRALVVGPELEGVGARVVLRDAAEGLERGRGVALDGEPLAQHAVRPRHRPVHVAVGERVVPDHVGAELPGRGAARRAAMAASGIDDRGERLVLDADALERVLRGGAVHRGHRGDRLARRSARGRPPGSSRAPRAVVGMSGRIGPGARGRLRAGEHGEDAGQRRAPRARRRRRCARGRAGCAASPRGACAGGRGRR